ncbi:hypothetical protein Tco_1253695 [Tanacetum coccineum]
MCQSPLRVPCIGGICLRVFEGYERRYYELSIGLSKKWTSASLLDGGTDTPYLLDGYGILSFQAHHQTATDFRQTQGNHATVHDGQIVTEPVQGRLSGNVVDLENKVRQEQALVIQRNKRNAELVQENDLLKSTLSGKEKSIAFLQSEKEKILSEKKDLADSYLDEIVCLKTANKVARDMLQRFNMPTQTIPMLSKKPKKATNDLHKDILGTRNPGLGYMAKRAQPVLYDADTLLHPTHHPVSIWDSEEVLVHQVVSMKKMNEKPGHVRPANGFYEKLNALMFVPQQELSREQAYWLPANERASQTSNPNSPVTPFIHKSRPPSQVLASLQKVNAVFHQFEGIIKERTTQKPDYVSEWCYDYAKQFVEQQLVPFYDHFKKHIQAANDTFFKEIREFEQIFDELEAEYEQCVLDNKNLTIEKKNLLIKNDCLIAECLEKDICSIVLTSDIVVPPSSNCLCEDLRSACDREHTKVLELEAEVLKQQKMVIESEKRNSHLQKNHIDLQLKFQNYKQCIDTSSASNAIFEINKLRKQLQGKEDTIRNLDAQVNIMKVLNVGTTESSCDQQALETDRIQLKDTITSLRIQLDGLKRMRIGSRMHVYAMSLRHVCMSLLPRFFMLLVMKVRRFSTIYHSSQNPFTVGLNRMRYVIEHTWTIYGRLTAMYVRFSCLVGVLNTAYPLPLDTAYPAFGPIQRIYPNRLIRLRMAKVVKGEFEKIKDVKVEDVSLTCDTTLEVFNKEHEADEDIGYDPSDVAFIEWLASKNFNYKTMDHYTMKALWIYWIRGNDEVELTDEESSDDEDEIAKVFRTDTNIFNYETPLCSAFNEFNYLLKVDLDLLTKDIMGFKTYEDYKDDWIYEWNKDVPWVYDKPWLDNGIWKELTPVKHTCKPFNYKTRCSEWPTCNWRDDGYCNGGNLPRTYIIGNQLHYPDYEWYNALEDSELKDEALRNKAIMEGFIKDDDDKSRYEQKRRWNTYTYYDDAYEINHEHNKSKELCEVQELQVCNIRRCIMIKYSFNDDEEYVAVKEDEYDNLTVTRKEACRAYQEIFQDMEEGWMVTRAE